MYCDQCGTQNQLSAAFCQSCGVKLPKDKSDDNPSPTSQNDLTTKHTLIAQAIGCYFSGDDNTKFSEKIGPKFEAKNASNLIYNIYCIPNYIILVPVSQNKRSIALWGLLLGGGALGGAAVGGLSEYARLLELRAGSNANLRDNPFFEAIFFRTDECRVVAKETRTSSIDLFDILKKETWLKVEGAASYEAESYKLVFEFGIEGQTLDKSKKHLKIIEDICQYTGITNIQVQKGKYP